MARRPVGTPERDGPTVTPQPARAGRKQAPAEQEGRKRAAKTVGSGLGDRPKAQASRATANRAPNSEPAAGSPGASEAGSDKPESKAASSEPAANSAAGAILRRSWLACPKRRANRQKNS